MRITIVSGFFLPIPPLRGGAMEKMWFRLAQEFAGLGHQVTQISRTWPGLPVTECIAGVNHVRVPGSDHTRSLPRNLGLDFLWGLRVGRALPSADVVLCNTISLPIWLPVVKRRAGLVTVVLGRAPKGQLRWYRKVRRVYALSGAVAAQAAREYPPIAARTAVMWCPIDWALHAVAARRQPGLPIVIGFVGRIHPEKGIQLLLSAAQLLADRPELPPWRLEVVGPSDVRFGGGGPDFQSGLERRFGPSLGGRLHFAGPEFDPVKLASRYGQMDVFCYPSIAEQGETFGVAVAEAMAAGCAPVVSALDCFADFVASGENGLQFDHRSGQAIEQLAAALGRLIADAPFRQRVASAAQTSVRRFDYPLVAQKLLDDLSQLDKVSQQL
jgi:glycosyltransferase involved in cell wall biosynthesis